MGNMQKENLSSLVAKAQTGDNQALNDLFTETYNDVYYFALKTVKDDEAKEFAEVAGITGVVLTKMDGTAKGGIAVAIQSELGIPVKYIGVGEGIDDLQKFDSDEFVNALFNVEA